MQYSLLVTLHIISASAFVMTMIIMQLVVANVMKRIPEGAGKRKAALFIRQRWHPVVDTIIMLVALSAVGIVFLNPYLILDSTAFQIKAALGSLSLTCASCNHFYFRYKKRGLVKSGNDPNLLKQISRIMPILDKTALIFGSAAAIMGWSINHL